jgi:uncharacterized coiled-coil protein SlyX
MRYKEMLIVLLISVIVYLFFMRAPQYTDVRVQTIEHVIEGKETVIEKWNTKIVEDKSKIKGLTSQVDRLKDSLSVSKELKDTILIIDTQDTIIKQQDTTIRFYEELVEACDSVMTNQNHLIELKDSVIMIQRNELNDFKNKKKRRKLGEIIAGIGMLTLLIVK